MSQHAVPQDNTPSALGLIIALVASTVIAMGGGAGLALVLFDHVKSSVSAEPQPKAISPKMQLTGLQPMPPILTNLSNTEKSWIRLETSLVLGDKVEDLDLLVGQLSTDIISFLRTLTLAQIEGSSGFQHLREDLNERVALRSKGQIRELVVHSMIVE